jgi:hypothetical protein
MKVLVKSEQYPKGSITEIPVLVSDTLQQGNISLVELTASLIDILVEKELLGVEALTQLLKKPDYSIEYLPEDIKEEWQ